jgi:hypothetical protein
MHRVRWWFWVICAVLIAVYLLAGYEWSDHAPVNDMFDIGAIGTFCAAAFFVALYSVLGFFGPAKWWRNDVGTMLVLAVAALLPVTGPLAWAVVFNNGMLVAPLPVWIEIGGMYASCLMILGLSWLWFRYRHEQAGS